MFRRLQENTYEIAEQSDSTTLALHNLQFKIILSFYATFNSALQLIYTVNKTI